VIADRHREVPAVDRADRCWHCSTVSPTGRSWSAQRPVRTQRPAQSTTP